MYACAWADFYSMYLSTHTSFENPHWMCGGYWVSLRYGLCIAYKTHLVYPSLWNYLRVYENSSTFIMIKWTWNQKEILCTSRLVLFWSTRTNFTVSNWLSALFYMSYAVLWCAVLYRVCVNYISYEISINYTRSSVTLPSTGYYTNIYVYVLY